MNEYSVMGRVGKKLKIKKKTNGALKVAII